MVFGAAGAAASIAVVVLYGLLRGDWLQGVLAGIAVGMLARHGGVRPAD